MWLTHFSDLHLHPRCQLLVVHLHSSTLTTTIQQEATWKVLPTHPSLTDNTDLPRWRCIHHRSKRRESHLKMSGYAVVPEEESSPSATSWAATIPSPNATKSSPEQRTASPSSSLSINWFCRISINKHYPVKKGFGGRVPPTHWRGGDAQMKVWRRMTRQEVRRANYSILLHDGRQQGLILTLFSFPSIIPQQDEEWSRWSSLPYEIRKAKTETLERIQAGGNSPRRDSPKDTTGLTLTVASQTDKTLLDYRDVADEAIIELLSKHVKTTEEKVEVAPPAPMPPSKPLSKPQPPKPPVAEVTVARNDSIDGSRATSQAAASPSSSRHKAPYGLAPRYSSYPDTPQGPFSYPHYMPPPQASASRAAAPSIATGRADTGRSLFDAAAHGPKTPTRRTNQQINDEEYDRIQRNESARHLIRLLS